ncbi:hypothetical protein IMCC14465_00390 [alpha proteobacterium IMCC14465]|uniref:UDP-2,3-diacylglucosamine pyrophosphatase n=1 Tax=alpha proteobacterium IMCC14465 TaxID=1220535 RepID=J9A756_9PROT|nr:hypothetical protein IMCC14465_00390 [alpha proteobacterium IMCC14465]
MLSTAKRLGVIAGAGVLPGLVAEAARNQGYEVCVFGIIGACDQNLRTDSKFHLLRVSQVLKALKRYKCKDVVIIGGVTRPNLFSFVPDLQTMKFLARAALKAQRSGIGDDAVLRILLGVFEEHGVTIHEAREFLTDIIAPSGVLSKSKPSKMNEADIKTGRVVTEAIGRLDIGQCCVVCRGQVLAIEGPEGTDEMLGRVANLPHSLRGSVNKRAGVLVKLPKPGQDRRIDMPTIGLSTVENASFAGLAGIAFAREETQLVDIDACIKRANELGVFLIGLES